MSLYLINSMAAGAYTTAESSAKVQIIIGIIKPREKKMFNAEKEKIPTLCKVGIFGVAPTGIEPVYHA